MGLVEHSAEVCEPEVGFQDPNMSEKATYIYGLVFRTFTDNIGVMYILEVIFECFLVKKYFEEEI